MESKIQQRAELVKTGTLQFFLAIALGLIASIVANAFVEGARWFESYQTADGLFTASIGGMHFSFKIFV